MNEKEISRLREGFAASVAPSVNAVCPGPEKILAAVRGELPAAEMRVILDHTIACSACAEDWRLAAAFEAESAQGVSAFRPPLAIRSSPFRRYKPLLAAAAAASFFAVVGLNVLLDRPHEPPAYRTAEPTHETVRSLLAEGEALPRQGATLRWTKIENATYDVTVSMENSFEILASASDLETAEYEIPPNATQRLPASTTILWKVKAVLPDGRQLESATFETVLR